MGRSPGNLPVAVTSFVGRDAELRAARKMLAHNRLVTLTGPGGVGKSRVARRLGEDLRRVFPGGVWLVDLASAPPGTDVARLLPAGELDHRLALLLLDNCEHLLAECAEFIAATLHGTAGPHILVTSRQPIGMLGEHVLEIAPLGTAEAVELFTERASAAIPTFALSSNKAAVTEVCGRLDGIPFAIELAALAPRVLSLNDLLDRLAGPGQLLRLSSRAAMPRQRSLHASHSWSLELCTEQERCLWARLSVFAARFDVAAVVAVCSGHGIERDAVLDLLARLVEKSIVTRAGADYRLLESTRQFGVTLLRDTGDRYRERHARYFTQRAAQLTDDLHTGGCAAIADAVDREHSDLGAAADFLMTQGDRPDDALRVATLLCLCRGDATARRRLREVLQRATTAQGLVAYGMSALAAGEDDDALREAAVLGDQSVAAYLVEAAGLRAAATGDLDTAWRLLAQAFQAHVERADEYGIRQSYRHLLVVAWSSDDPRPLARARALATESGVALAPGWAPYAAFTAGLAHLRESAVAEAVACFGDALAQLRRAGDHRWISLCCDALTQCARLRGDVSESVDVARLDRTALTAELTRREVEVAELVCLGLTNRAIGEELSVSTRTIESHVEHIMTKLGCARRTQVAARFTAVRVTTRSPAPRGG